MSKSRLSVYLEPDMLEALTVYAARRRQSLSMIAEAAIASFVNPDDRELLLVRHLRRIDNRLSTLERDTEITGEALMIFIRDWLRATPSLSEDTGVAAEANAKARYEAFMTTLGQRLATPSSLNGEPAPVEKSHR